MLALGSSWKEDVIRSSFFPFLFLFQYRGKSVSVFVPSSRHICTTPVVNENLRGGGSFFPLYFSYYLFSLPFLLGIQGNERRNLARSMPFLSCTAVYVLGYYNWVPFSCLSTKVPSYFVVPRLLWQKDDNIHVICFCFSYLQIVSSSEADQLLLVLWSCCLSRLEEQKKKVASLQVEGGRRTSFCSVTGTVEDCLFSCRFFSSQAFSALCKINVVSENAIIKFILTCLSRSSKTGSGILVLWSSWFSWASTYRPNNIKESPKHVLVWDCVPHLIWLFTKWSLAKLSHQKPNWCKQCIKIDPNSCWNS